MANETLELERSAVIGAAVAKQARAYAAGDVIAERYRVLALVGEGGMGRVYRVHDALHPDRAVALKTLALASDAVRGGLFEAEFRTMSELAHPNIGRVHDFETLADGATMFTMEYIDGRDLGAACVGQPLARIVEHVVEACRALQYLHSRGVIHADVKPRNMLVTVGGVKVVDFGLAGAVRAGLVLGTPVYMAPELAAGRRADERSDLYALGITLYELVFGTLPFTAATAAELAGLHARAPIPFPRDSPVAGVITRLCHKLRDERYASANQVIDALGEALGQRFAAETSETRRSYASAGRLVGREREHERRVEYCLGDASGTIASVAGPSGVGKSRLVLELRRQLQLAGMPFIEASCYEGSFSDVAPLAGWSDALCVLARTCGSGELVGDFTWLHGEGDDRARDEGVRLARLRALAAFVVELARGTQFVLHLGDAQWARTSTLDFVRLLYDEIVAQHDAGEPSGLRVVASYRDDEVEGRPLAELLAAAPRRVAIALAPLSPAQTGELIAAQLGAPDVPALFGERVFRDTGGNPFFVEEVVRALLERGDVYVQAGRWAAPIDVAALDVPATIAAVLDRRVVALVPDDRELLDDLAIYAQPMSLALLAACRGHELGPTRTRAERLAERHLLVFDDHDRAHLAHDKLREFLAGRMTVDQRVARHLRIARTLDATAGGGEYVFERAHHYWYAGEDREACRWAETAAELGERTFATDAAIDNYDRLRVLRTDDAGRRAATEKLLALSLIAGHYRRIVEVTEHELARDITPLDRAWLLQLQGEALGGLGRLDDASERLREAGALAGGRVPRGRFARRLFIAWHYVRHLRGLGRPRPTRELAPDDRRRREILAMSYFLLSVYAMLLGDEQGIGVNIAAYNAIAPLGPGELAVRLTQNMALVHHLLGRYRASEQLIRAARELAASDADRAAVLVTELLARQSTQQPIFAEQKPVYEYEQAIIAALGPLAMRSRALYLNLARVVATTTIWQFSRRFRDRPEVTRWAEAMRGTVHYTFVQGGAAALALVAGDRARAEQAYARAAEASSTPFYRAWLDASFAWQWSVAGERTRAIECLRSVATRLPALDTRTATALPVLAFSIGAVIAVAAHGEIDSELRGLFELATRRLDRRRRLPPYLELYRAVGRFHLGRGSLAELERAHAMSAERWQVEQALVGHPDGCIIAALALGQSRSATGRAAAATYADEAMRIIDERYPAAYAGQVRALLRP